MYKIVIKIIDNRLKGVMGKIIGPKQCSFIPGRHSTDNIVIAQEAIHSIKAMKGKKKSYMALKVDHEKAYDKLD